MKKIVGFAFVIALIAGGFLGAQAEEKKTTVIKRLFNSIDLSKHDKNIDSVLDKEHVSSDELELLKAQAMLEALEENAYSISSTEELIPATQIAIAELTTVKKADTQKEKVIKVVEKKETKKDVIKVAEKKKSLDERLKDVKIEDRLKTEFSTFAETLKGLVSKVVKGFEEFQDSDEVKNLQKDAEESATEVGTQMEKVVEDFVKSDKFKELQDTAAGIFKKLNEAISGEAPPEGKK